MSLVTADQSGGVLTVTLGDEQNRNALSAALMSELTAILDEAEVDASVRVIVLTNTGTVFCAGANLKERSGKAATPKTSGPVAPNEFFARFARSAKPYVGRLDGHCVAGGLGLAASMDISIARDDAKFAFTEVRIGVAPAMISVLCLPKMRTAEAREAMLRGNRFLAPEAAHLGLINAAVPAEQLDGAIDEVVNDLLAGGPEALAATKRLLLEVPQMTTDDAFAFTSKMSAERFRSAEAAEGMTAYLEKRPAAWVPDEESS
jgi:methylglutaconyl-CoA hydratase